MKKPRPINNPFVGNVLHPDYCTLKDLRRVYAWIGKMIEWMEGK